MKNNNEDSLQNQSKLTTALTNAGLAFAFNLLSLFFVWLVCNNLLTLIGFTALPFELFWLGALAVTVVRSHFYSDYFYQARTTVQKSVKKAPPSAIAIVRCLYVGVLTGLYFLLEAILY